MQWVPYAISSLVVVIAYIKNKIISSLFVKSQLYIALALMIVANLEYPSVIQYTLRAVAMAFSTMIILAHSCRNTGKHRYYKTDKSMRICFFLFMVYIALAMLSTMWSIEPLETLIKSIEVLIDVILVYLIIQKYGNKGVVNISIIFISFFTLIIVAAFIGLLLSPSQYIKRSSGIIGFQMRPFLFNTDPFAAVGVMLFILLLNTPEWKGKKIVYFLSITAIILTQARTSLAIFGAAIIIHMISRKAKPVYIVMVLVGCIIIYLNFDTFVLYFNRGSVQSNIENLNGRRVIWEISKQYIKEKPILGYGFGAGGYLAASQVQGLNYTHNGYYETAMGIGFTGVVLLSLQPLYASYRLIRKIISQSISCYTFELMIAVHFILRTYTAAGIGSWSSPEYIFWIFCMMILTRNVTIRGYKKQYLSGWNELSS